ncbi:citrate/2-methylcitrate synthase, partial [Streptomyces sp. NPDC127079]|uniref:citrate/2-methylcitrate synthase n=1 Tax=Streptomyces sp. NPDC127079 TaxID=3347132 RepID=UPI00365BA4C7
MTVNRTASTLVEVPRGLAGVVVTDTEVGDVRGSEGYYHYRQYSAVELARTRCFEDVWHLLVHGELPGPERAAAFAAETAGLRRLPDEVRAALPALAAGGGGGGAPPPGGPPPPPPRPRPGGPPGRATLGRPPGR